MFSLHVFQLDLVLKIILYDFGMFWVRGYTNFKNENKMKPVCQSFNTFNNRQILLKWNRMEKVVFHSTINRRIAYGSSMIIIECPLHKYCIHSDKKVIERIQKSPTMLRRVTTSNSQYFDLTVKFSNLDCMVNTYMKREMFNKKIKFI